MRALAGGLVLFCLAGCVTYPEERLELGAQPEALPRPDSVSIMTYNIEGLTWPARTGRAPFLEKISEEFARMAQVGELPDVVVFQEAFSTTALRTAAGSPHPIFALGPRRSTKTSFAKTQDPVLRKRNILRGEWGIKTFGSGLAVASRYAVSEVAEEPFGPSSCAGWDCLSNKGMLLVRVHLPGYAAPLEILTTHMNSQGSSGVSKAKQVASHKVQSEELAQFINQHSREANPLIIAGDFNMRGSPARFEEFERQNGYMLARRYCQEREETEAACEIAVSWDGDAPWMDTQDLQIFDQGTQLRVRPVKLEAWFDGDDSGGKLSDHDAYVVTYALEDGANSQDGAKPNGDAARR